MAFDLQYFTKCLFGILSVFFYCEYAIYYIVLLQCSWPNLSTENYDFNISVKKEYEPLKVLLFADTHLLGSRKGHWFDKLRREWQMYRAFQTSMTLHSPDVVFVLGDLFDEGLWCSAKEFNYYVDRFHSLFYVPKHTQLHVVVGNHDIGFHYSISKYLHERFARAFNTTSVQSLSINGNIFVLINSMALEGDNCFLCKPAVSKMHEISERLHCTRDDIICDRSSMLEQYSHPVLLQHFPLYRNSDAECHEPDEAPQEEKDIKFRERWDCLSKESTDSLFHLFSPRLVVTGHTHHGCHIIHQNGVPEWTLPSFNWRNKKNPSFMLAIFTPNNYSLSKCYMPIENTVIMLYCIGLPVILFLMLVTRRKWFRPIRLLKKN